MKALWTTAAAGGLLLTGIAAARADNDSNNVSWRRVIGIIQAGNAVGKITGGGQPWSTLGGEAHVNLKSGHIEFEVRGLALAGGNAIGTPDGVNQVKGTIVCDPGGTSPTPFDTDLVPLSAQGDAEFSGKFSSPLPAICTPTNVTFLVRVAAGRWIANGTVRSP